MTTALREATLERPSAASVSPQRSATRGRSRRGQAEQWLTAPLDAGLAVWNGWTEYLRTALRSDAGGLSPLRVAHDTARWVTATTTRQRPEWAHRHHVVREWPQARLLDFSTARPAETTPTLVLPPQAGHASTIVDYSPGQSQLITAREAGLERIYAMDWKPATWHTRLSSIDDYVAILDGAIGELGGVVNLVGDCQGGWLATIYAALHPEKVNALAIGGAPIDFHAGDSAIQEWVGALSGVDEMAFYRLLVALGGGNHLGQSQILGFKMLEPTQELDRLMQLWGNIRDDDYVARHVEFTNWFEWGQRVPGSFYLWIVKHLFVDNELVRGTLRVAGQRVDLAAIDCPLFLLAGTTDHITPAEQVFALADHVGTPSDAVHREIVDGGHLGLFMGRASLVDHWTPVFGRITALSRSGR